MAIAFDAVTDGGYNTSSFSHTCTGANRVLIVMVTDTNFNTTGITYNSVSMTAIVVGSSTKLFYLLNPASGSNTVSIAGVTANFRGAAISYTGVNQTAAFPDAVITSTSSSNTATLSPTVLASGCWLVGLGSSAAGVASPSLTTDKTSRLGVDVSNSPFSPFYLRISDSNGTVGTGSQSVVFTATGTPSGTLAGVAAFSMAPQPPSRTNGFFHFFDEMTVG